MFRSTSILLLFTATVAGSVAVVLLNVHFGFATFGQLSSTDLGAHPDYATFRLSAEALWRGENVYETGAGFVNLNPPFFILVSAPLAWGGALAAYQALVISMTVVMVASLAWMASVLRTGAGIAVTAAAAFLVSSPMLNTLALGQIYPILTLGLVAAWVADRRGWYLSSGLSLGLVVALKPSLAPIVLWPLVRRRWDAFGAAVFSGGISTLLGALVLGFGTTVDWLQLARERSSNPWWDNASLVAAVERVFTETENGTNLATLPGVVTVTQVLGVGLILLTALWVWRWGLSRRSGGGSVFGLWALVAVSLLASPITWHNYLLLLAPGILILLATGRGLLAWFLILLQLIPPQWPQLFPDPGVLLTATALTLYTYVLIAHWLALSAAGWGLDANRTPDKPAHNPLDRSDKLDPTGHGSENL